MPLKEKLRAKIGPMREKVKKLVKDHGDKVISEVKVSQVYTGIRGVKCLPCDTSNLDPMEGIRFRGYTIPEVCEKLPKSPDGEQPLPEGMFYLLLLGDIPTAAEVDEITEDWHKRSRLTKYLIRVLEALPSDLHPMTQFSVGILELQRNSVFAKKYRQGMPKNEYWEPMYEDVMNLLAKLPALASYIYRKTYHNNKQVEPDLRLDWGANFAHMLGSEDPLFKELMRLYLVLLCDHESGNVSAHATHLVGSSLSDAFYSLSAGINGLAGPLHGLANQEVLRWIMELKEKLGGGVPTKEQLSQFIWDTLKSGQVIPGYGHAVLRATDPRYVAQRNFALKYCPDDEVVQIVNMLYEVAPEILRKHGKAKNPWPNVDAYTGCLLSHFGITEYPFYTVFFGVSRAMGVLVQLIWSRALGLSIERPKSITSEWILSQIQ